MLAPSCTRVGGYTLEGGDSLVYLINGIMHGGGGFIHSVINTIARRDVWCVCVWGGGGEMKERETHTQ